MPHSRQTSAISSSSVDTTIRSSDRLADAASSVHAMSGLPARGEMFLPGIPFEPPRAVTNPSTRFILQSSPFLTDYRARIAYSLINERLLLLCLALDPRAHPQAEQIHWLRTIGEKVIVKCTDVELRAQRRLGLFPELQDFELADLVCQRLTRPGDVSIDFGDDVLLRKRRIRLHEINGPLPRPAEIMHPRIDNQST